MGCFTMLAIGNDWEDQMKRYNEYKTEIWQDQRYTWYSIGDNTNTGLLRLKRGSEGKGNFGEKRTKEQKLQAGTELADQALFKDINWKFVPTLNSILIEGVWYTWGWGTVYEEEEEWEEEVPKILRLAKPDDLVTVVWCKD